MRIPLVGYIPKFIHDNLGVNDSFTVIPIIIFLIILLIIAEFVVPMMRKKDGTKEKESNQKI